MPERPRKADEWALQQWRAASLVKGQEAVHLFAKTPVGGGIRCELVTQEVPNDVLGIGDRVPCHWMTLRERQESVVPEWTSAIALITRVVSAGLRM